jgi:multidrug efflux pump subunit AcrA (membrane-fusion protein)
MPTLLKNLMLDELSLVDRPANAQAMVSLFKRDDSQEDVIKMNDEMEAKVKAYMEEKGCGKEEAMKALGYDMEKADDAEADLEKAAEEVTEEVTEKADEDQTAEAIDIEALKADVDALKAENEFLRKGLIENGFVIKAEAIEKKAEVEMIEVEGEMVVKSDIPAPVLKALEAAAIEKADIELTKRAGEALPHFDITAAKALVKSFGDNEAVMAALLAADKSFEAAMQEFGKSDVDGEFATAADKLDALVKSYMEDNQFKKSEYAKAYAAVAKTDEGKALINKSYKGE